MADFLLPALAQLETSAGALAKQVCDWANPALPYASRVTAGWPMTGLDKAILVLAAYAVLVAIGFARIPKGWKPEAEKKKKEHWLENFKNEPIRIFQALYNLVQVTWHPPAKHTPHPLTHCREPLSH